MDVSTQGGEGKQDGWDETGLGRTIRSGERKGRDQKDSVRFDLEKFRTLSLFFDGRGYSCMCMSISTRTQCRQYNMTI